MRFLFEFGKNLVAVGAAVQVLSWLLGYDDGVKELLKEYRYVVLLLLGSAMFFYYIIYDSRIKLEKLKYEKKRKQVPTHRRKSKKSKR